MGLPGALSTPFALRFNDLGPIEVAFGSFPGAKGPPLGHGLAMAYRGFLLASGSLAGRYFLGDGLTQRCIEGQQQDWRRSALFTSFGAAMGGPAYLFYAHVPLQLARLVDGKWKMVAAMILVDTWHLAASTTYSKPCM